MGTSEVIKAIKLEKQLVSKVLSSNGKLTLEKTEESDSYTLRSTNQYNFNRLMIADAKEGYLQITLKGNRTSLEFACRNINEMFVDYRGVSSRVFPIHGNMLMQHMLVMHIDNKDVNLKQVKYAINELCERIY